MAKELPYFKFDPSEWITGDITLCSMDAQGLFINICTYYWKKDCSICLANVKQRFSKYEANLNELLEHNIILLDDNENIIINFLDEQMSEFIDIREKRAIAGAKGGKANAKQMLSKRKAKSSNKDKIREDKRREEKIIEHPLQKWILNNLKNVTKLKLQLSKSDCEKLIKDFGEKSVKDILLAMENKADLYKKYISVNLTARTWLRRDIDRKPKIQEPEVNRDAVLKRLKSEIQKYPSESMVQVKEILSIFHGEAKTIAKQKLNDLGYL